uniref:Ig-like domain-containing protein n=1 Tax=Vespula pensylvanica TaxID=30213 RepID=A0A834JYX8_VESPE|nr:hypothetical protein H0235_016533 [Vespula pensylvanica]
MVRRAFCGTSGITRQMCGAGISGKKNVGSLFLPNNLTGEPYLDSLENYIYPLTVKIIENDGNVVEEAFFSFSFVSLTQYMSKPVTEITGGPDLFINKDSTINLTCLVRYAPEPPSTIIWSHNRQAINFDSPRGGISLITEKGPVTSSRLLIQKAIQEDSGLYTCSPNNTHPNSVRVHIVNENPEQYLEKWNGKNKTVNVNDKNVSMLERVRCKEVILKSSYNNKDKKKRTVYVKQEILYDSCYKESNNYR